MHLSTASQMHKIQSDLNPKYPTYVAVFFWAYVFYLSKILKFIDTARIPLSPSTNKQLTFLHVYHRVVVVVMWYLWLHTSQSLLPVALITNASVHTMMWGYYVLCSLGRRPPWKRLETDFQIFQFVFIHVMLWFHFSGCGCCGIWVWCFDALFNASLLALRVEKAISWPVPVQNRQSGHNPVGISARAKCKTAKFLALSVQLGIRTSKVLGICLPLAVGDYLINHMNYDQFMHFILK
ncbi:hypothetical protein NE237_009575 [Protea cynaroides]|uniref:very-long-chain 3-oxoacyl-CoA synthase n=1 Tax=Protea cynaroides TaxID=273540 RepID=A0A9Q0R0W0_9MAGN|nr:hypothetical protein NE237_009575 [Protea cynaroides]